MPSHARKLPLLVLAALAAIVAVALAAPARTVTLSASTPTAEFDGSGVTTALVTDVATDDTLVKLSDAGTLTVTASEFGPTGEEDLDIEVFKSDEAGEPQGEAIVTGEETATEETVSIKNAAAGNYLVRVYAFIGANATFKGKLKLVPAATAPAPAASPGSTPTPAPTTTAPATDTLPEAAITKLAKSANAKKFKSFSGTASDDKGVTKVEVAIVLKKGKKCTQLKGKKFVKLAKCGAPSAFKAAKGTTAWTFKAPKLKKGSYTAFARAVDSAGQKQGGFGPKNKKAFKLK
jgi:hypothetical protein